MALKQKKDIRKIIFPTNLEPFGVLKRICHIPINNEKNSENNDDRNFSTRFKLDIRVFRPIKPLKNIFLSKSADFENFRFFCLGPPRQKDEKNRNFENFFKISRNDRFYLFLA
jgi:hypothetical protein